MEDAVQTLELEPANLTRIADVLEKGLKSNFAECEVRVTQCPDLTKEPFHLASFGFGSTHHDRKIIDVGGIPNLIPTVNRSSLFDLRAVARLAGCAEPCFLTGAGAGPFDTVGVNSEMMTNVLLRDLKEPALGDKLNSHISLVSGEGRAKQSSLQEARCGLMMNLLATQGLPGGEVLEVKARTRTGRENFVTTMRLALEELPEVVALGGVFVTESGTAHLHVMPNFSETPLNTDEDVNNWLNFYDVPAPLVCLSVFVNRDPGMALRVEHTHCFIPPGASTTEKHGGGHYHYDITPDTISYRGIFVPANQLVRVYRPQ